MRKFWLLPLYIAVFAWICAFAIPMSIKKTDEGRQGDARSKIGVSVLTIGGSVSHGWDDMAHGGFLHRTFNRLSNTTSVTYTVYDKTIVGANEVQLQQTLYKGDYEKWLIWYHPNVVVLAWGLLNDCLPDTPKATFRKYVTQEINEALARDAVVYVVTPPVTKASYTKYKTQEQDYVNEEKSIVQSMNNPNVLLFDVFGQMKQYLVDHGQTYVPYMSNGWHPNAAGHALAANLLVTDINNQVGTEGSVFKPTQS